MNNGTIELHSDFGLRKGQSRPRPFMPAAGWFSANGTKLGFGDIDADDIRRIQQNLVPGQHFLLLEERHSDGTHQRPNPAEYCAQKCAFIITIDACYGMLADASSTQSGAREFRGVTYLLIGRDQARRILGH